MKKNLFAVLLIVVIAICFTNEVFAYSPHYLPGGDNYLSEDNFETSGDYYVSSDPFLVKPYTDYILTFTRDYETQGPVIFMEAFQNGTLTDEYEYTYLSFEYDETYEVFHIYFKTESNTNYLSLRFSYASFFATFGMGGFMLEEGTVYDGYEPYTEGNLLDTTSPYFQSAGTVISYVDTPISIVEIQSALKAYDAIDGDVSSSIIVTEDNYTASCYVLGTYTIIFAVADSSGNLSDIEVTVQVVDAVNPMFTDIGLIKAVYPNSYLPEDIIVMLSASDNYDGDISSSIVLESDGYSANNQILGTYEMEYSVTDSSGNCTEYTVQIEVVDEDCPIFSGTTSIVIGYDSIISSALVKSGLSVTDNYDLAASLSIELVSDTYTNNHDILGDYEMGFEVYDSTGNRTEQAVTLSVVDEIGPVVYFDCSIIQVYNDTVLSLGDVAYLLSKTNEINAFENYNVIVLYDSYSRHATTPGTYHLSLEFTNDSGQILTKNFQIKVNERPIDYYYEAPDMDEITTISFWNKNRVYLLGGGLTGTLFISNLFMIIFMKKKKAF